LITDLDQLHKVVNGELQGIGVGRTFARCHVVVDIVHGKLLANIDFIPDAFWERKTLGIEDAFFVPMGHGD
jgi:hypothetical protein